MLIKKQSYYLNGKRASCLTKNSRCKKVTKLKFNLLNLTDYGSLVQRLHQNITVSLASMSVFLVVSLLWKSLISVFEAFAHRRRLVVKHAGESHSCLDE